MTSPHKALNNADRSHEIISSCCWDTLSPGDPSYAKYESKSQLGHEISYDGSDAIAKMRYVRLETAFTWCYRCNEFPWIANYRVQRLAPCTWSAALGEKSLVLGSLNTLRPRQNGRHFAEDIFSNIFMNEKFCILIKSLFLRVQLRITQH